MVACSNWEESTFTFRSDGADWEARITRSLGAVSPGSWSSSSSGMVSVSEMAALLESLHSARAGGTGGASTVAMVGLSSMYLLSRDLQNLQKTEIRSRLLYNLYKIRITAPNPATPRMTRWVVRTSFICAFVAVAAGLKQKASKRQWTVLATLQDHSQFVGESSSESYVFEKRFPK